MIDSVDAASMEDDIPGNAQRTRSTTLASSNKERKLKWYEYLGRGMYMDVKSRLPYYVSDWTDAWNYRVVPATLVSNESWVCAGEGLTLWLDQVIFFANVSTVDQVAVVWCLRAGP